jgi:hypothetical protein
MKMLHLCIAILVLALSGFAVSGCGGSSKTTSTVASASTPTTESTATTETTSSTPATPPPITGATVTLVHGKPLSRASWLAAGDAICARTNTLLSSVKIRTEKQYGLLLPQAAAYDRAEVAQLRKIVPPTADTADWLLIINNLQKFGEYTQKVAEDMQANNVVGATPLVKAGSALRADVAAIAKRDGFHECAHV